MGCCGLRANHQTRDVTSTSRREKNYLEKLLMLKLNDKSWGMLGDGRGATIAGEFFFGGIHIFCVCDLKVWPWATSARMPLASRVTVFSRWQERRTFGKKNVWINNLQIDGFKKLSHRMELTPDNVVRVRWGSYVIFLFRIVEIISQSTSCRAFARSRGQDPTLHNYLTCSPGN